jgi:hypothetical protein
MMQLTDNGESNSNDENNEKYENALNEMILNNNKKNRNDNTIFSKFKKKLINVDKEIESKISSCDGKNPNECRRDNFCILKRTVSKYKIGKKCVPKLTYKTKLLITKTSIGDTSVKILYHFNKFIKNINTMILNKKIALDSKKSFNELVIKIVPYYHFEKIKKHCDISEYKKNLGMEAKHKTLKKKCESKNKCTYKYKNKTCIYKNRYKYNYVDLFIKEYKKDNYKFITDLLQELIAENDIRYQMYKNDMLIMMNKLKIGDSKLNEKIINILLSNILKHSGIYNQNKNNLSGKSINNNLNTLYEKILNKKIYDKTNNLIYFIIDHIQHGILDEKLINIFKYDAAYIKSLTKKGLKVKHINNHMSQEDSSNFYSVLNKKTKGRKYKFLGKQFGKRNNFIELFNDPIVGEKITKFMNRHKNNNDYDKLLDSIDKFRRVNKNVLNYLITLPDKDIKKYLLSNNIAFRPSRQQNNNTRPVNVNNVVSGGTRNVLNKNVIRTTRHRHTNFIKDIIKYIVDIKNELLNHQAELLNISKTIVKNKNVIIKDSMEDIKQLIKEESINFFNKKVDEIMTSFYNTFQNISNERRVLYDNFNLYIQLINIIYSVLDKLK